MSPDGRTKAILVKIPGSALSAGGQLIEIDGERSGIAMKVGGAARLYMAWARESKLVVCYSLTTDPATGIEYGYIYEQPGGVGSVVVRYIRQPRIEDCPAAVERAIKVGVT